MSEVTHEYFKDARTANVSSINTNNAVLHSGNTINTADLRPITPVIKVSDSSKIEFEDGSVCTGRELRIMFKALKKLAAEEYPEEFV